MRLYHRTVKLLALPRHLLAGLCRSSATTTASVASTASACVGLHIGSTAKHLLHCALMFAVIMTAEITSGGLKLTENAFPHDLDPWQAYGFVPTIVLYALRALTLLTLPQVMFNFCGLVFYNAFPDKVVLKGSPLLAPFICVRVVTRGDFPDLVKANVLRNLNTCLDAGLEHFLVEVVTDRAIGLAVDRRTREVVVPTDYRPKSGAMFKSRALQYCLEDSVNLLSDGSWLVHLDEETLLTENSVRGIVNFVLDGKHAFGQGLITYANEQVVNWMTTLADSIRVSDDMGKVRFQFRAFHKPVFSWKGSYVVTQYCVFCENNNEPVAVYKSHVVRDQYGRCQCPVLRRYVCPRCGAKGDNAHTLRYCTKKPIVTMDEVMNTGSAGSSSAGSSTTGGDPSQQQNQSDGSSSSSSGKRHGHGSAFRAAAHQQQQRSRVRM